MRDQYPFRRAGGAGGKEHIRWLRRLRQRGWVIVALCRNGRHRRVTVDLLLAIPGNDPRRLRRGEDQRRLGGGENMLQALSRVIGIKGQVNGLCFGDRQHGNHHIHRARQEQRDAVAGAHALIL